VTPEMAEQEFAGATFVRVCRRIRTNEKNEYDPRNLGDVVSTPPLAVVERLN
jgi:hypothetical protein